MARGIVSGRTVFSSQDSRTRRLARRHREQSRRRRLLLESLENRSLLATLTWVGDQDANWNTNNAGDTNWDTNALPADGDTLIFAGAAPGPLNNDTAAGNSYTLQFTATGYTIAGNDITLDNAGTDVSDTVGGNAVNTPLTVATSDVDAAAGLHTLGGVIGGAGGLTKLGAGTLALSNANTYAGSTAVNGGTLRAQNGSAIPDASDVTVGIATLELQSSETVASFTGGAASNLILGANTLTTTGNMAIAGVTTAGGGLTAGTAITDNNGAATNISGTSNTLQAATGIGSGNAIETSLDSVTATTTGAGPIQLAEANAITLTNITAANGPITVTTGGATIVTNVVSMTDADANDISITASTGNMTVATVTAGAGATGDVKLEATLGSVLDDIVDATLITADVLTIFAFQQIGAPPLTNPNHIDSKAISLVARITGSPAPLAGTPGIWITEVDDLTVTSARTNDGVIILRSGGTMTALLVSAAELPGALVRNVNLSAANFVVAAGSLLSATGSVTLNCLTGPSTVNFAGDVDSTLMTINGTGVADIFNIRPDGDGPGGDQDTPITINGNAPAVSPGDVLNLDVSGKTNPNLTVNGTNNGAWNFSNAASVAYTSIEQVNVTPALSSFGLTIDMNGPLGAANGAAADTIRVRVNGANLEVVVDGIPTPVFTGNMAEIDNLTILGSGDNDTLVIEESPGGLPQFSDDVVGLGDGPGGAPTAGHTSSTFTAHTGYGSSNGDLAIDIHFNGSGGVDQLQLNLIASHSVVYTSDNLDANKSGNVGIGSGGAFPAFGTPQMGISFESLAPITVVGAGGTFTADASSSPPGDVTSLTIDDAPGAGTTSISPNAGSATFESVVFSGFTGLVVRGGLGAQTIDLVNVDGASGLANIVLDADNLTNTDIAADTVRVQSTGGLAATVRMLAGQGNDTFRIEKTTAPQTIDGIAGQVFVSPIAGPFVDEGVGNDALIVSDIGDASGDTVLINEFSIEGITSFGGSPDIDYRSIDTLNLTATAGNDVIDATFAPGSDLDFVNLSGWTGADQFFLKTTDEQIIGALPTGIQTINLFGDAPGNPNANDGNDIFGQSLAGVIAGTPQGLGVRLIRPSITTAINIDGGRPTANPNPPVGDQPGDELNLDVSAMLPPVIVATLGANTSLPGVAQSIATPPSHRPVTFIEIEDINLVDELILTEVQMGDLYIRGSDNPDAVSFLATTNPNVPRVRVNAFQGFFTVTRKVVVYGRGGNDNIQMGNFNHALEAYGEEGDDYIAGYNQADKLVGGSGRDRINAVQGNNVVWGDSDPVEVGLPDTEANRQLMASIGPGQLPEDQFADILSSLDGLDTMYGGPGIDSMTLGGGNDYAYGGQGNDSIALGLGDDHGYGGLGNDTITGSAGNDLMNGGEGNDILNGEVGLDVLIGGGGNDGMNGGDGNDLLFDGRVTYNGTSADSQTIGDANDVAMAQLLADWAVVAPGTLSGAFTNDRAGADQVRGQLGADSFSANPADILDFVLGVDTILP